jgi:nucleoside-diphosphate-sugar epimerase
MPSLNATHQNRILVTGGNGFIGAHVVKLLLDRTAYQVVTTVRTAEKADKVIEIHGNNPHLTVEIVPDITAKDAFLVASADCDAVIHLASPFGYAYENFERELLIPSIDGAKAICYAANSISSVKRVIFASSFASVYDASPEGMSPSRVYTERDWSPLTYEDGKNALATPIAYRASKVLAEQEAWRLCMEQNRWDLVSLCPGMVLGALVDGSLGSLKDLNTSNALVWGLLDKDSVPDTKAPCEY